MTALLRMRLTGFVRTGRALAPLIAVLAVLGILYGGGKAQAGEAYGVSAAILFGVLAWQTKVLLDIEPDVQRRLARVAVGGARKEITAGILAAIIAGLPMIVLAMLLPWLLNGISGPQRSGDQPLAQGIALGIWAHLLVLLPAVALGALASRAVARQAGRGLAILLGGTVLAIVLGLKNFPAPWLAPPVMATARDTVQGAGVGSVALVTLWGLAWTALMLAGYARLRVRRP